MIQGDHEILHGRALRLARPLRPALSEAAYLDLFLFALRSEVYGIEISHVDEVFAMKHFTPVPSTPEFLMGVTSLHGEIISLVDLGCLFQLPRMALSNLNKVVVVRSADLRFGIVIDEALDIRRVLNDALREPPAGTDARRAAYLMGITPDNVIVVDMSSVLADEGLVVGGTKPSMARKGTE